MDNGPVLSIVNPDLGQVEGPTLEVKGDRLRLLQEECAAGGDTQFFDNEYSYEVQDDTLTTNVVKNQCADRIAEAILTSEPWSKAELAPRATARGSFLALGHPFAHSQSTENPH